MNTKYIDCAIKTAIGALVFLILFLGSKTVTEMMSWDGDDIYPSKTITVTSEGEAIGIADIASFSFTVEENDATSEGAQKKATEKYKKASDYLKSNGVDEKDIKTENYSIYPKYEDYSPCYAFDCPPSTPKIVGYTVYHSTRVKVRDSDSVGKFIGELTNFQINNISGVNFTVDDDSALYDQARNDAIAKAKIKSEKLEKELGVKLGDVISFSEDYPYAYNDSYGMGESSFIKSDATPDISAGQNLYKANIYITYELK